MSKQKKVLLLTDGIFPYQPGGMQKHSYYLAKYLLKAGYFVELVHCVEANKSFPTKKEVLNLLEHDDESTFSINTLHFPTSIHFPGHYLYNSFRYSNLIYKTYKETLDTFSVIYCQGFSGWKLINQTKNSTLKAKIISNFHGLEMFQLQANTKSRLQASLLRFFVKKILKKSPFIHSLGGNLTTILTEKIGIPLSKIISVPIGIEQKWLRENSKKENNDAINFCFIGRNERRKGFPELMESITHISQANSNFHFHIIGPFPKSTNHLITYHGQLNNEQDIMNIMDQCDVLILPSYAEGMPTVILEAMSRGCAIAATDVGAVCEQVSDENGWLFLPANKAALDSCLQTILNTTKNEILLKGQNSIHAIQRKFLWDSLINKIVE